MERPVMALAIMLIAATGPDGVAAVTTGTPYSIQVRAVPLADRDDGLSTYRALRDKGYLVYHHTAEIDGKTWLRIAVGVFRTIDDAAAFGRAFTAKEGMDHFVARAPARIHAATGGDFVLTPSALWTRRGDKAREVFRFDDPPPRGFRSPGGIRLKPSPDGQAVAFQYGMRVYAVRLGDDAAAQLTAGGTYFGDEHDYGPTPHWSPSGRYVAFHDFMEWEVMTSLWVARADGSDTRPLVDNRRPGSQSALKAFIWHPAEDRIFFINGHAWGAAPSGGDLYMIDMDGRTEMLAGRANDRENLSGRLRIADGHLYFNRQQFDENYSNPTITEDRIPLAGLSPAQ